MGSASCVHRKASHRCLEWTSGVRNYVHRQCTNQRYVYDGQTGNCEQSRPVAVQEDHAGRQLLKVVDDELQIGHCLIPYRQAERSHIGPRVGALLNC